MVKAIRGATTVTSNTKEEIMNCTKILLNEILFQNIINKEDIISIIFTMTSDLNAEFPAKAAREMGFIDIPLLDAVEISVPDSLEKCIRVLMHINTQKTHSEIKHVYLNKATLLRKK